MNIVNMMHIEMHFFLHHIMRLLENERSQHDAHWIAFYIASYDET